MEDFITNYLEYARTTPEVPKNYSRWAALIGLGAYLGRRFYFDHGSFKIYPNIYGMLIGVAGARKGTAIKLMKNVLQEAGYNKFSAERTSKEKFLLDLAGEGEVRDVDDILEQNLFGSTGDADFKQCFIAIDEFNDFIGQGNIEFISMLGNMWNYSGVYTNRIKSGKSVDIPNPTISILGGNTPTNFALAFPPAIVGQGFLSRMIIIHGAPNGTKVTFPPRPTSDETARIVGLLQSIGSSVQGPAELTSGAEKALDGIYHSSAGVDDVRFESYSQRRLDHLIKLCIIVAASRGSRQISERDVIYANTILSHTERFMVKALGEFGKAKHSDVAHKILTYMTGVVKVVKLRDLWAQVSTDLDDIRTLCTILNNLEEAGKIIRVPSIGGFLPKQRALDTAEGKFVDWSLLTPEELEMKA